MTALLILFTTAYSMISAWGMFKLKSAESIFSLSFVFGFALYATSFLMWVYMLRRFPLSIIFPVSSSMVLLSTQLMGYYFFNETITPLRVIACVLIVVAVILLSLEMTNG